MRDPELRSNSSCDLSPGDEVVLKFLELETAKDLVSFESNRPLVGLSHPNIVTVYEVGTLGESKQMGWIAMEKCNPDPLYSHIQEVL